MSKKPTQLIEKIRVIEDFPQPGVSFKDITTLLKEGPSFRQAIDQIAEHVQSLRAEVIVGPEARGFVIGAPVAYALGLGFVPIRKAGKLPAETIEASYDLEYGTDRLGIHRDAIQPGQRVVIVDDLLATGGTISTAIQLVEQLQGEIVGLAFLIELCYLKGREKLSRYPVFSLVQYD